MYLTILVSRWSMSDHYISHILGDLIVSCNFPWQWIFTSTILSEPYLYYPFYCFLYFATLRISSWLSPLLCFFLLYPLFFSSLDLALMLIVCPLFKNLPSPISIWEWCFTYHTLVYILSFTVCKSCFNFTLCCTHAYAPLPLFSHPCLLSNLTLVISIPLPNCLLWTHPLKNLHFLSTQFESCELPISLLVSFPSLLPYKFYLNFILRCVFICYHHYLVIHRSCLDTYLYACSLKISSLPPQFESGNLPIWPLDKSSSFSLVGLVLTPSFVVLIFLVLMHIYLLFYILVHYHL
jgi:hypothetical protein